MNTVTIIGRLTADPDLRATHGGKSVCTLGIAVPRMRGRNGEDRGAAYIDVETWGKQAEACAAHLAKGRQVAVTGRLEHQQWTGPDDKKRSRTYVIADEPMGVQFLDRPQAESPAEEPGSDEQVAA